MGNSNPTDSKLRIFIETDKTFYNSGSTVKGVVFIDADDDFLFDALYIRIEGIQHCKWFEGSSKNRRRYLGDQNFYTVQHMLSKYQGTLTNGRYAYPFSIELSENIPGSFFSATYQAKIQYKLIAYFTNFTSPQHRQYEQIPLIIRQPFRQQICEFQGQVTKSPKVYGCCSAGQVYIKVNFEKNVCFVGQSVKIQILADNKLGRYNINSFTIKLIQYTFVSANNGANRTYQRLIKKSAPLVGVQKGQTLTEPRLVDFLIPDVKHQTAISTLVANYYRLQVSADIAVVTKDEPTIYSPIFILKKSYDIKGHHKNKRLKATLSKYDNVMKMQSFKCPEYWFRKNKNLSIMNFRVQDGLGSLAGSEFYRQENSPMINYG